MNIPTSNKQSRDYSSFYAARRQFNDEILFDQTLKPIAKRLARAIAQAVDRETGSTFADLSTFARRVGAKLAQVRAAEETLIAAGRLKVERRGRLTFRTPVSRGDARERSTSGSKRFYRERAAVEEVALHDVALTHGECLVVLGISAFIKPNGRCDRGQTEIAKALGIARKTVVRAMPKLVSRGYVQIEKTPASEQTQILAMGHRPGHRLGHWLGHSQSISHANSMTSTHISGIPNISDIFPTPSVSAPIGERSVQRMVAENILDVIYQIINDYHRDTISGVIAVANSAPFDAGIDFGYINALLDASLLSRDGQRLAITKAGFAALGVTDFRQAA